MYEEYNSSWCFTGIKTHKKPQWARLNIYNRVFILEVMQLISLKVKQGLTQITRLTSVHRGQGFIAARGNPAILIIGISFHLKSSIYLTDLDFKIIANSESTCFV